MEIVRTDEIKEFVTFETLFHKLTMKKDDYLEWLGTFKNFPTPDTRKGFVMFMQKKLKLKKTDKVIDGAAYNESFSGILNHILKDEFGVNKIIVNGDLNDFIKPSVSEMKMSDIKVEEKEEKEEYYEDDEE